MSLYPHTFTPLEIHGNKLKNRIVMGSMHTGLEDYLSYKKLAAYFKTRAEGDVGLMITGGFSPNFRGRLTPIASQLSNFTQVSKHRTVTNAVHESGGKIILQILHAGRYAHHPFLVAPSAIKAPIVKYTPKELTTSQVEKTISHFVRCAKLAKKSGYDGVEIMGSEGYFINQFISKRTNHRTDRFGGSFEKRIHLPLEILRRTREELGDKFLIIYRISALDLVKEGSTAEEVLHLAKECEQAGASILNTGIGWHEARIPTIAAMVPRAAFQFITKELKNNVSVPTIAVNRFNNPDDIETCLRDGFSDLVSMARPFLADPNFVKKMKEHKKEEINTCIACNQACLDHIFELKRASCLVNPLACYETEYKIEKSHIEKKILIVGAGPAGLSCALTLAERGHKVHIIDKNSEIGGQFNLAKVVPSKSEFYETLRYYSVMLKKLNVKLSLETEYSQEMNQDYDEVVFATGVSPRIPKIQGIDHEKVVVYKDVLSGKVKVGEKVAIIGGGGIGLDTATYLLEHQLNFYDFWGIDKTVKSEGGLTEQTNVKSLRDITIFQRSAGKFGKGLGKTTVWAHRIALKKEGLKFINNVQYKLIDDEGLHFIKDGRDQKLNVDHIIICSGQTSYRPVSEGRFIGGAKNAQAIDAKRAIKEGFELGLEL